MKLITHSEKATLDFAKKFAQMLKGGEVIGLIGDLGAGKTIFTKGLAVGLGIKANVTSPTFALMKIYKVVGKKNIKQLCHIDAYRIKSANDISAIGADEYFGQADTISVIEWADNLKKILPNKIISVNIKYEDENNRKIIIN
jgi:tRNA threonylcarbamoyladenosine biosynthesis protein TsaE